MAVKTNQTSRFAGLNNVSDPLRLGLGWLSVADNVDVTDTGAIKRRMGYAKVMSGTITGAFTTRDYTRMLIVDGGVLKQVNADMSTVPLKAGLSAAQMYFTEINEHIYFTNGVDYGVVTPGGTVQEWAWVSPSAPVLAAVNGTLPAGQYQVACTFVLPDGRETGTGPAAWIDLREGEALSIQNIPQQPGCTTAVYIAPANSAVLQYAFTTALSAATWAASVEQLGHELTTQHLSPVPRGAGQPMAWRGRIYLAEYIPQGDMTVVWKSEPLGFHLFDQSEGFFVVPGEVLMLAPVDEALIVGTDKSISAYNEEGLTTLAEYGVVRGWGWDIDDDQTLVFWTRRGLCRALPFAPLTEKRISVNFGVSAGAAIIRYEGRKKCVVALQKGGSQFNHRG